MNKQVESFKVRLESLRKKRILKEDTSHLSDDEIWELADEGDKSILDDPRVSTLKNEYGDTPLHYLAYHGVKEVLDHPDAYRVKNADGYTPVGVLRSKSKMTGMKMVAGTNIRRYGKHFLRERATPISRRRFLLKEEDENANKNEFDIKKYLERIEFIVKELKSIEDVVENYQKELKEKLSRPELIEYVKASKDNLVKLSENSQYVLEYKKKVERVTPKYKEILEAIKVKYREYVPKIEKDIDELKKTEKYFTVAITPERLDVKKVESRFYLREFDLRQLGKDIWEKIKYWYNKLVSSARSLFFSTTEAYDEINPLLEEAIQELESVE